MSILVVCPGCRSRFQVSDQYAGRAGACPKCKGPIKVPGKDEQVKIHGGEDFERGGRSASGQLVLKPIARAERQFNLTVFLATVGGALVALAAAWLLGGLFRGSLLARGLGLLVITPPVVYGGYFVLRDEEREPFLGRELYLRVAICSLAYIALWAVFGYVGPRVLTGEIWGWLFVAPPFLILGGLTALACFDMEFGAGVFHYAFYVLVALVLRWATGMQWIWDVAAAATT